MSKTERIIVRHDFPTSWAPFLRLVLESYTKTLGPDARRLPLSEAPLVPLAFCALLWWLGFGHLVTRELVEEAAGRAGPPGPKPKGDTPQTSLFDVVTWDHDDLPGVYVSLVRLKGGTASATCGRYTLDLHGCHVPETALPRAYAAGWGVLPERRGKGSGASDGLRFLPPSIVAAWFCDNRQKLFNGSPSIAEPTPVAELAPQAAASEPQPPCHPKPCFYHQAVREHVDPHSCADTIDGMLVRMRNVENVGWAESIAQWLAKRANATITMAMQTPDKCGAFPSSVWSADVETIRVALSAAGRDPDTGFLRPRFTCDCPAEGCEGPSDARHRTVEVCPRCLDVVPGVPAGDPDNPHPGPFAPELCTVCALNTSEPIPSFLAEPHAPPSSELPDPSPNFPPSDFFDNQPEPAEDPAPSEKPAPSPTAKRKRGRPKGSKSGARQPAESAIHKGGKRATT